MSDQIKARLAYLRAEIKAERISQDEIAELQSLVDHIDDGDVLLLEWAGVPENLKSTGRTIELPVYGIRLELHSDEHGKIGGVLSSGMGLPPGIIQRADQIDLDYQFAINGLEAMILACACAGVDIESPQFIEAIESAAQAIGNEYDR